MPGRGPGWSPGFSVSALGFIPRLALCLGFLICKIEGNNRTWLTGLLGTLNALNIPRPCERCLARQRSDTSAVLVIILQSCSDDEIETHVAPRTGSANGLRCSRPSPGCPGSRSWSAAGRSCRFGEPCPPLPAWASGFQLSVTAHARWRVGGAWRPAGPAALCLSGFVWSVTPRDQWPTGTALGPGT